MREKNKENNKVNSKRNIKLCLLGCALVILILVIMSFKIPIFLECEKYVFKVITEGYCDCKEGPNLNYKELSKLDCVCDYTGNICYICNREYDGYDGVKFYYMCNTVLCARCIKQYKICINIGCGKVSKQY